ncbi:MAG TPA: DUF6318 family protein [Nocardioides sp.]|nr:DUF6318 family protein [Nocardioides sp.]
MRRTPAARLGTALAAAALLLAGCADDGEPRSDPTWSPTAVPESPSTTPADAATKPALPDAATKATKAGAEAFIQYYWDVANYAQATGHVHQLRAVTAKTCAPCLGVASDIRRHYEHGGTIEGGANAPAVHSLTKLSSDTGTLFAFQAKVAVAHGPQEIHQPDGSVREQKAGTNHFTMYVAWVQDRRWRLEHMELK